MRKYKPSTKLRISPYNRYTTVYRNDGHHVKYDETVGLGYDIPVGVSSTIDTSTGRTGAFNPCTHQKSVWSLMAHPGSLKPILIPDSNPGNEVLAIEYSGLGFDLQKQVSGFLEEYSTGYVHDFTEVDWTSLAARAVDAMRPSFQKDNSLVNFIHEMRDFKGLAKALWNRVGNPREGWAHVLSELVGFKKTDEPMAKLAKGHLQYSFAWAPLYRDVASLCSAIAGFKARFTEIVKRANVPQQSYYGTDVLEANMNASTVGSGRVFPDNWYGGATYEWYWQVNQVHTDRIRYHATMRYRYPLPSVLNSSWGKLFALMDSLGVNANLAIIWNAIPFSFVVDWLVNIGRLLDSLRVENVTFQTEILDFCHSVKTSVNLEASAHIREYNTGAPWGAGVFLGRVTTSRYVREAGLPPLFQTLTTTGLSVREFLLGSSLVRSRRRKRIRPR